MIEERKKFDEAIKKYKSKPVLYEDNFISDCTHRNLLLDGYSKETINKIYNCSNKSLTHWQTGELMAEQEKLRSLQKLKEYNKNKKRSKELNKNEEDEIKADNEYTNTINQYPTISKFITKNIESSIFPGTCVVCCDEGVLIIFLPLRTFMPL